MRKRLAVRRAQDAFGRDTRRARKTRPRIGKMFFAIGAREFGRILRRRLDNQQLHGHGVSFGWRHMSLGAGGGGYYRRKKLYRLVGLWKNLPSCATAAGN